MVFGGVRLGASFAAASRLCTEAYKLTRSTSKCVTGSRQPMNTLTSREGTVWVLVHARRCPRFDFVPLNGPLIREFRFRDVQSSRSLFCCITRAGVSKTEAGILNLHHDIDVYRVLLKFYNSRMYRD